MHVAEHIVQQSSLLIKLLPTRQNQLPGNPAAFFTLDGLNMFFSSFLFFIFIFFFSFLCYCSRVQVIHILNTIISFFLTTLSQTLTTLNYQSLKPHENPTYFFLSNKQKKSQQNCHDPKSIALIMNSQAHDQTNNSKPVKLFHIKKRYTKHIIEATWWSQK